MGGWRLTAGGWRSSPLHSRPPIVWLPAQPPPPPLLQPTPQSLLHCYRYLRFSADRMRKAIPILICLWQRGFSI